MKTIMIPIHPEWVEKIINREKTVEIRKFVPKCGVPFKVLMYVTNGGGTLTKFENCYHYSPKREIWDYESNAIDVLNGKVVGEFVVKTVERYKIKETGIETNRLTSFDEIEEVIKNSCLNIQELRVYAKDKPIYAWHISDLKVYDEPKELSDFRKLCIMSEMPYCPACKFGNVQYSSDEVECFRDIEGASCEWLCANFVRRPPQSWQYIQELED